MQLSRMITTIDTHTAGEPTRIVTGGIPHIPGRTMREKKSWLANKQDHLRKMLMWEPRGHRDMFGAIITTPSRPDTDIGIIYMDNAGYLDMCVHGSIGAVTALLESGMIKPGDGDSFQIHLDAPAGKITADVLLSAGRVEQVTIRNVPSFFVETMTVHVSELGAIPVSVCYAGNYFAIVDSSSLKLSVEQKNLTKFISYGLTLREQVNRLLRFSHPLTGQPAQVGLVEFYEETSPARNVVIFGGGQVDRSPCGTGTGAKMALLHARNQLAPGQPYPYRSVIGTEFVGEIVEEVSLGQMTAIIPAVTGRAHIIGLQQFVVDDEDPFKYGFGLIGN